MHIAHDMEHNRQMSGAPRVCKRAIPTANLRYRPGRTACRRLISTFQSINHNKFHSTFSDRWLPVANTCMIDKVYNSFSTTLLNKTNFEMGSNFSNCPTGFVPDKLSTLVSTPYNTKD